MKNPLVTALVWFISVLLLAFCASFMYQNDLRNKLKTVQTENMQLKLNTEKAFTIIKAQKPYWYAMSATSVSSEPDGQGIVITFDDGMTLHETQLTENGRIFHPDNNQMITFDVSDDKDDEFVLGGLLAYYYVDVEDGTAEDAPAADNAVAEATADPNIVQEPEDPAPTE